MSGIGFDRGLCRKWLKFALISLFAIFAGKAHAYVLILDNLSNGYSACSWRDNGDGTSTVDLSIAYKEQQGHTGDRGFYSRGLLVYTYDRNGRLSESAAVATDVYMGDVKHQAFYTGIGYVMYHGAGYGSPYISPWKTRDPFVASVRLTISNQAVSSWPAIGVRAGNYTTGDDVGEISGVAYIRRGENTGNCKIVVDPSVPPPLDIAINMTAPDWNLGDLPRGDSQKTLSDMTNQLCFTYSGKDVSGKRFIINARNANGVAANRYRLKHVDDASQLIPYDITLNSGASTLTLPNASNATLPLGSSGKTCFVPTFKTTVDANAKDGDYSDVLTFTVVTPS
ncbi:MULTISPECIES: hypothetical protein [Burkholderia]|uniref:Fimbrial protein n=1 Tax=Burkholderia sola TaxID=2843302 RepID=A0ABV2C2G7_9BURK|nr:MULTISPECIES: hypothetical protein [unclassified Burkholderia]MBP0605397.1 hypothetical protein [Burkholderia sp. CpTa8-5]MBP0712270.1 hypothetical protein [Burkholderia sp. AcTa6-5]